MKACSVQESINFERYQDPKKAMNIGKIYSEKEKIKSIDWEFELEFEEIFKDYYKFIENYKGYPILIFKTGNWIALTHKTVPTLGEVYTESKEESLRLMKIKIDKRLMKYESTLNKRSSKI